MNRFQINSSQLFLTYPQCPIKKEDAFNYLEQRFVDIIEQILVAQELHKNGMSHLHVYVKLKGPYRSSDPNFADLKSADGRIYHGNYQGCRSSKNVIKYCTKEDNYVSNFDVGPLLSKRSTRREHMESIILGKRTIEELIVDEPQYLFNYSSLTNSFKMYKEVTCTSTTPLPTWLPNPWGKLFCLRPESFKKRHFHIYSSGPNAGKTTWANSIISQYGGIIVSNKEPYWNVGPSHRFIFLDEYHSARLRYDELNAMADGTYCYRRCGSGVYQFQPGFRPYIIILSNDLLSDLYPFKFSFIDARYKFIDVSSYKFL